MSSELARKILTEYRTWAVVGWSPSPMRDSNRVASFLESRGYRVIRVNPHACDDHPGCFPDLASIDEPVEVVDVFRRSEAAGAHVDEAIAIGAKAVWMQLGVIDPAAARRAEEAGLDVVMDRCPAIDHPRLVGV
ncbi:MAG TPA: CoA-binding protein [Thermoleophilaceae bacterium]|nr:CoA-binding protein [Thermoleophilaceae bacterium]